MNLSEYVKRLVAVAATIHRWAGSIGELDQHRRERVAIYAERIADTLGRASEALARLEAEPGNRPATRAARREIGRIEGYVETIVHALRHHLDGRKLNGVKRRLEQLENSRLEPAIPRDARILTERLAAAEGYFRALSDALRA